MNPERTLPMVLVLHGPAGVGKLTVAREVAARSGWPLFHNHLTVDLLLSLFPFGSPGFVRHREEIWLRLMPEVVREGRSLVFTFTPERSVDPGFPPRLEASIQEAGGQVEWVSVTCDREVQLQRVEAADRKAHGKLDSRAFYLELEKNGAFAFPPLPTGITLDTTATPAAENAVRLLRRLGQAV
jgi:hypothetical protein